MANHNFEFKDSYSEEDVWKAVDDAEFYERYQVTKKNCPDIEIYRKRVFKYEEELLKELTSIGKIANQTDIPEEFLDFWIIYNHGDNDFDGVFDDINYQLAEEYQTAIRDGLEEYSRRIHQKDGIPVITEMINKEINRSCKYLTDKKKYSDVVRHFVAFESAKRRNDFDSEFQKILNYFNEDLSHVYLGTTDGALKFLNEIKFDENIDEVTEENFNKTWWNGDVSITRVMGNKIIQV